MTCRKVRHTSKRAARKACAKTGNRLRTYRCPRCGWWHVANADREPPIYPPKRLVDRDDRREVHA